MNFFHPRLGSVTRDLIYGPTNDLETEVCCRSRFSIRTSCGLLVARSEVVWSTIYSILKRLILSNPTGDMRTICDVTRPRLQRAV